MRTNRSLRGGSGKARAIRQFKSARPDHSSFVSTNCMFRDKALLPTALHGHRPRESLTPDGECMPAVN
jgi:hypothetical protein